VIHLAVRTLEEGIVLACRDASEARHPARQLLRDALHILEDGAMYTWERSRSVVSCEACLAHKYINAPPNTETARPRRQSSSRRK
jgi:hypothetical protein